MIEIFKTSRRTYVKQILAAADKLDPKIRAEFIESVRRIQDSIVLKELAETIDALGVGAVDALVDIQNLEKSYAGLMTVLTAGMVAGGGIAATHAKDILPKPKGIGGAEFRFNVMNPKAVQFSQEYQQTLIRELSTEARETVEQVISRGITEGQNPLTTAREVRANIGLTAKQEQAVQNYRKALEGLDRTALDRKLRDKRFDSVVNRAIGQEKPLKKEQIDRMVGRYRQRYVKHRSEVIGQTESMRAVNSGEKLYWDQAVEDGLVQKEQIRREWVYTKDRKTREAHRLIPSMNEGGVGIDEAFQSIEGPIRFPHDPLAPASLTIGCRCTTFTRVISQELL